MSSINAQFKLVKGPIYSHCFNADRSALAITYENNCYIYSLGAGQPRLVAKLSDHDKTVTAVDISIHGRIVTCSQDRNAIVWEPLSDGSYKPTLVLLRINRSATCAKWAPNGYKFAVGSSARIIAVCYYEQENDWWVSKHIKKPIRSTVNTLSWHDNGVLLASGGSDGYVRVFSGFVKGLDNKDQVAGSPWGDKFPFGALVREWRQGSWIHDLKWRSRTEQLAYVAHDGTMGVVDYTGALKSVENPEGLPFKALLWIDDNSILCGGYSCHPVVFAYNGSSWQFARHLDKSGANAPSADLMAGSDEEEGDSFGISALKKFKELDLKGKVSALQERSTHENAITQLLPFALNAGKISLVSSSGLDGKVVIYKI
ncbi:HER018Cp [Eremothecium sinecaudum]|uniref:Actin-related protein 2/3 complex subunit n=1 Tax=Eremothecium sinecaudum TaxID=45286 RepID=A0A0X8HTR1_9SACH|nr:HER018Cp [Eremothecium sinecaudum]AMD21297.1 HER018Cp [Eremothecium sinecaudum]